jgi:hypothetical protein
MAAPKETSKTSTRKPTGSKARQPRTVAAAKPKVTEKKVGDQKLLDAAVEAGTAWKAALAKRDEAIRKAVAGGTSARQVAIAVGLTHPAVLKIVKR